MNAGRYIVKAGDNELSDPRWVTATVEHGALVMRGVRSDQQGAYASQPLRILAPGHWDEAEWVPADV
jgi:hypothetical protein